MSVQTAEQHRVAFLGSPDDLRAPERQGLWRDRVFCIAPFHDQNDEWEDPATRDAKRARYVQSAMHEQSMGRRSDPMQEMALPDDAGALACRDEGTRAEWDALNQYHKLFRPASICADLIPPVSAETQRLLLRPAQSGPSHVEAQALARPRRDAGGGVASLDDLDRTQRSFAQHLLAWAGAYRSQAELFDSNLPSLAGSGGEAVAELREPVLLLGTAGTGKTTTLQAANAVLEDMDFAGRIVRVAYTGVAASNMGSGSRTIMSLLRLSSRNAFFGLRTACSLERRRHDAAGRRAWAHGRAGNQRAVHGKYHPLYCSQRECRCGTRLPFGSVKVVLGGDFGQLPPVAVVPEKTLLNAKAVQQGQNKQEVNLGLRLFMSIRKVFRLRRIHRQVGQSTYKESLLRIRDAAHTKEDVALWQASPSCTLTVKERLEFEKNRVHMFCENRRAGMFNGQRLGEHVSERQNAHVLRIWSVESSHMAERHKCEHYGQLQSVVHLAEGAQVMLLLNVRSSWDLVNGLRGTVVAVVFADPSTASGSVNAAEVGGVSASSVDYVVVDFPGYSGPEMVPGPCCARQPSTTTSTPAPAVCSFPSLWRTAPRYGKAQ